MCDTQEEVDYCWDRLTAGGDSKAQRTMTVMLPMKNLDIAKLKQAHDG